MRTVSRSGVPSAGIDSPTTAELFSMVLISLKWMSWSPTRATTSPDGTGCLAADDSASVCVPCCCASDQALMGQVPSTNSRDIRYLGYFLCIAYFSNRQKKP